MLFQVSVVRTAGLEPAPQHFWGVGRLSVSAVICGYDALLSEYYGEQVWRKTEARQGFCCDGHAGINERDVSLRNRSGMRPEAAG